MGGLYDFPTLGLNTRWPAGGRRDRRKVWKAAWELVHERSKQQWVLLSDPGNHQKTGWKYRKPLSTVVVVVKDCSDTVDRTWSTAKNTQKTRKLVPLIRSKQSPRMQLSSSHSPAIQRREKKYFYVKVIRLAEKRQSGKRGLQDGWVSWRAVSQRERMRKPRCNSAEWPGCLC